MRFALPLLALVAAAPAANAQEWRQAREVDIRLSNFDIDPGTIALKAGEPVKLRLINNGPGNYVIEGEDFFAAARVRRRDARWVSGGSVFIPSGETREVALVPARGRYSLRSANIFYRILGMRSEIAVD